VKKRLFWFVVPVFLCFFSFCFTYFVYSNDENSVEVFIYGLPSQLNLSSNDVKVIFYNINEEENFKHFFEIVNSLYFCKVPIIPERVCLECLLTKGYKLEDVFVMYDTPLMGIFKEGKLVSIVIAITDKERLDKILSESPKNGVKIFTSYNVYPYSLNNKEIISKIEELFLRGYANVALSSLIFPVLSLAVTDSINPCTFLVFTGLLLLTLKSCSKAKTVLVGISFISSVLIGYYTLGLFLNKILLELPNIKYIVGFFGLVISFDDILRGLKKEFRPRTPTPIRRLMSYFLQKAYLNPLFSAVMGLVASYTLLPCSGGPYVVSIGLMSVLKSSLQFYILLLIYNLVFVFPLIVILASVIFTKSIVKKIEAFRKPTKVKVIPLTSGILLAVICILILIG
jgi:cytochrome c biogenesis protein CcdA